MNPSKADWHSATLLVLAQQKEVEQLNLEIDNEEQWFMRMKNALNFELSKRSTEKFFKCASCNKWILGINLVLQHDDHGRDSCLECFFKLRNSDQQTINN